MPPYPRLFLAFALAAAAAVLPRSGQTRGYAGMTAGDTARPYLAEAEGGERRGGTTLAVGTEIEGFLSSRGLPPRPGRFVVTDTGLVFRSHDGRLAQTYPLIGPVRERNGRRWRAPVIALAYRDSIADREMFVFRMDGGVFGTDMPGPLLDLAGRPRWLDSVASREWRPDRPLVGPRDTAGARRLNRTLARSRYADTLYALFGRPVRPVGLVSTRGRSAGRLGEYIASRDSLALDPTRMTSREQHRHALAHELAHRWQSRAPGQLRTLWQGVPPIPDARRYGHGNPSEHQAEAVAFAVHFLQATASSPTREAASLLEQYELLVPGTGAVARYLALQPIYTGHPLRRMLTTGERS
ncbi:MAG TPA: hypothetical protein VH764_13550 [Gemmatimonadales bacterium]|jgi:hypothetical protein